MSQRREIKERYELEGGMYKDLLCAWLCTPCDLIQQEKECEYREGLVDQEPPPVPGMTYTS